MAAAASALNAQAGELVNAVAVFKLEANSTSSHSPARRSAVPARAPMATPSYKAPARSSPGSSAKSSGKPASLAAPKTGSAAPAAPAASAAAPRPAAPSPAPAKAGGNDDDWESF